MHTTTLNWESLTAIVGSVAAVMGVLIAYTSKKQRDLERRIASAVENQTALLLEKLETKEAVNLLRIDMAKMATTQSLLHHLDPPG